MGNAVESSVNIKGR